MGEGCLKNVITDFENSVSIDLLSSQMSRKVQTSAAVSCSPVPYVSGGVGLGIW